LTLWDVLCPCILWTNQRQRGAVTILSISELRSFLQNDLTNRFAPSRLYVPAALRLILVPPIIISSTYATFMKAYDKLITFHYLPTVRSQMTYMRSCSLFCWRLPMVIFQVRSIRGNLFSTCARSMHALTTSKLDFRFGDDVCAQYG